MYLGSIFKVSFSQKSILNKTGYGFKEVADEESKMLTL
jgi:hypothetical protein